MRPFYGWFCDLIMVFLRPALWPVCELLFRLILWPFKVMVEAELWPGLWLGVWPVCGPL